jgi:basic membrane protein A
MKHRRTGRLAVAGACAALFIAGCGGSETESSSAAPDEAEKKGVAVAALFPGLVDDHSWNEAGFAGLEKAKAEGVDTAHTESVTQDQQLETMQSFAQQGRKVIIGHGGEFLDAAKRVAKEFPDTQFVVSNGTEGAGNLTSLALDYGDIGYLAGVLAAASSKSKKLGMVVGMKIPIAERAEKGYRAGAAAVDPSIEVTVSVTGSFTDVSKAREATLALIGRGVDGVFPLLDSADAGVYSAAEDEGANSVGLYGDVSKLAPKTYIGSPKADPSQLVYRAATEAELLDGTAHYLGVKDDVIAMEPFPDGTSDKVKAAIEKALAALKAGEVSY